jgi:hypothetical protein
MDKKEYIDRGALIEKLSRMIDYCEKDPKVNGLTALFQVADAVMDCTAADVVEVRHGEWEKVMNHRECNRCRYKAPYKKIKTGYHLLDLSRFCPNCGAKMDGERKEQT